MPENIGFHRKENQFSRNLKNILIAMFFEEKFLFVPSPIPLELNRHSLNVLNSSIKQELTNPLIIVSNDRKKNT